MARRYVWPQCTVPGCGHVRTYTDEAALDADIKAWADVWVVGQSAVCACHPGGSEWGHPFPCDPAEPYIPDEPATGTCAACGADIVRAPETLDLGFVSEWRHVETRRDYRHAPWPTEGPGDD